MIVVEALLARCRFPEPRTAVACAVSGGADSMALLVLATQAGLDVSAIHVDHGLREGSAAEADVVAAAAERFGARFESIAVSVEPGPDLEARARSARYAVLPKGVCTGHTADDRAETMLLNLLRGAGLDGLAALRDEPERVRRPLLGLRRSETAALCTELDLEVVDDPSNRDPAFRRNRVRHELLPLLDIIADRDVAAVLARQGELFADDAALLDLLAAAIDPTDARALAAAPLPLARRAVRTWLRSARVASPKGEPGGGVDEHPPDLATVDRVLAVARGEAVGTDVGEGRSVRRSHGRLRLVPSTVRA